jgi:hypothetical protein
VTVEEAKLAVAEIRFVRDDDEKAHAAEDALRHRVLEAIAAGDENAKELAAVALQTTGIEFSRWCA